MKDIATVSLLACLSHGVLADDQATPSPTPAYLRHRARPGSVRRMEQLNRRRAIEADVESSATARAQDKASRRSSAAAQAQSTAAARDRERAQRQVDSEARLEAAKATPRPASEVMKRMGFSEQEIAAQKALEETAKPGTTPRSSPAKAGEEKIEGRK